MGKWGVGQPAGLKLQAFAGVVNAAFGVHACYQVGSSLRTVKWRDVDVRVILDDATYESQGYGDPNRPHDNAKWVAVVLAFSCLGKDMTGLPIDFQVQQQTAANKEFKGQRSALFVQWIERGCTPEEYPKQDDNFTLDSICIHLDGTIEVFCRSGYPMTIEEPFYAWGSGRDIALGVLHLGYGAMRAVEIASIYDVGCGNGIDVLEWPE